MKLVSNFRYYQKEIKAILTFLLGICAIVGYYRYRASLTEAIFSPKGMTVLLGVAIAGVAGAAIRIYYRVIMIKYRVHGK